MTSAARDRLRASASPGLVLFAVVVFAVVLSRPGYRLAHPLWLDEAWVADGAVAPLHDLPRLTSSTPIGWSALLRIIRLLAGPGRLRLLPLMFSAASVLPTYIVGRCLWHRRLPSYILAATVALMPVALSRNDLKSYSADGFVAVLLLALTARAEQSATRQSVATLVAVACGAVFVSNTTAFVATACLVSIATVCAVRRQRRRFLDALIGLSAFGFIAAAAYLLLVRPRTNAVLRDYWAGTFMPTGPRATAVFARLLPGPWWCALALAGLGVAVVYRRRLPATALVLPTVFVELTVAGSLGFYPFLEERTSFFFSLLASLFAAVAVAEFFDSRRKHPRVSTAAGIALIVVVALGARASYGRRLPPEDVRSQAAALSTLRQPGEPIIVDRLAAFAFAFYWTADHPHYVDAPGLAVGFVPEYDERTRIVVSAGRSEQDIDAALARGSAISGGGRRTWVVVSHVDTAEAEAFIDLLRRRGKVSGQRFGADVLLTIDRPH